MLFCFKILLRESSTFVDGRESPEEKRKDETMLFEPRLQPKFVDIVVALNNRI